MDLGFKPPGSTATFGFRNSKPGRSFQDWEKAVQRALDGGRQGLGDMFSKALVAAKARLGVPADKEMDSEMAGKVAAAYTGYLGKRYLGLAVQRKS
jgi:hypothetical protein